jgi:hypothetical protein
MGVNRRRSVTSMAYLFLKKSAVKTILGEVADEGYLYWI